MTKIYWGCLLIVKVMALVSLGMPVSMQAQQTCTPTCSPATPICCNGKCYPSGTQSCGASCCQPPNTQCCTDSAGNGLCYPAGYTCCGTGTNACSPQTPVCCSGNCYPSASTCCGTVACTSTESCCLGECYPYTGAQLCNTSPASCYNPKTYECCTGLNGLGQVVCPMNPGCDYNNGGCAANLGTTVPQLNKSSKSRPSSGAP